MKIESHFSGIREIITQEINGAKVKITSAIAWFTDPLIFESLVNAARRGCKVRLAILHDEINRRSTLNFERIKACNGDVFWIPEGNGAQGSLHHKFTVIDNIVVITGSYNWTKRASTADENILLVNGDSNLASGYEDAFNDLLERNGYSLPAITGLSKAEALKNAMELIMLEEFEKARGIVGALSGYGYSDTNEIVFALERGAWREAEDLIRRSISSVRFNITKARGEEPFYKLKLRTLEAEIVSLTTEKKEIEYSIDSFSLRQHEVLGDVTQELLRLRWQDRKRNALLSNLEDDIEAEKSAEAAYEKNRNYYDICENLDKPLPITEDQKIELKRLFREANMKCHPDRVSEENKQDARELFIQVQVAYSNNDLDRLRSLHTLLKTGGFSQINNAVLNDLAELKNRINIIQHKVNELISQINRLRSTKTFRLLASISDMDSWLESRRENMEAEIERLAKRLNLVQT